MRYLFLILALLTGLSGLFGKTPLGEPATHHLVVSAFCFFLTLVFWREHLKVKKEADQ